MTQAVWINFQPIGRRIQVYPGMTLLEAAREAGIALTAVCGGAGVCGACRVRLISGTLSSPGSDEVNLLGADALAQGLRLACFSCPLTDVWVEIPPESLSTTQRLQLEGQENGILLDPGETRSFPGIPLPARSVPLGLALDLGSTKLAAYLMNLETNEILGRAGATNPQIPYGEDVISRIAYSNSHPDGGKKLQHLLVEQVQMLAEQLCEEAGFSPASIVDVVAVGNTVIHHLLCGLPVRQLGAAPYEPAMKEALDFPAVEIGLEFAPGTRLYLPPNIAGFVGADHVAMLIGCGLAQAIARCEQRPALAAVDIGTNTEISLYARGIHYCCSCASGPTFEGAHIRDGMRAAPGAIEHIWAKGDSLHIQTIDDLSPVGICGSGILDGVASLLDLGLLNRRGILQGNHTRLAGEGRHARFILAHAGKGVNSEVAITRADVNEVQLAKSAIRAGLEVLLNHAGLEPGDLHEIIIAGAFGTYLDVRSAIRVGMFPLLPVERFRQVGNAAGTGARAILCSTGQRRLAEHVGEKAEYVELTTYPQFQDIYINSLSF